MIYVVVYTIRHKTGEMFPVNYSVTFTDEQKACDEYNSILMDKEFQIYNLEMFRKISIKKYKEREV